MLYSLDPELAPNTCVLSKHDRTFSIPLGGSLVTGTLALLSVSWLPEVSIFISIDPHHRQEDHGTIETEPFLILEPGYQLQQWKVNSKVNYKIIILFNPQGKLMS